MPVLPLFLICMTVAAERLTAPGPYKMPLLASVVAALFFQTAGHGVFAINYFRFLTVDADRQAFLMRNVNGYTAVPWINANLKKTDLVFIDHRQLKYTLRVPIFFGSPMQAAIDLRPDKTDARNLYRQLRSVGITHFLIDRYKNRGYAYPLNLLERAGCFTRLKRFNRPNVPSRTLPSLSISRMIQDVLRLKDEACLR